MAMPFTIFSRRDVMAGREIDRIRPHAADPILPKRFIRDARAYARLAEGQAGPIAAPVDFDDIWGDALQMLERVRPAARVIKLETSVTASKDYWGQRRVAPAAFPCDSATLPRHDEWSTLFRAGPTGHKVTYRNERAAASGLLARHP